MSAATPAPNEFEPLKKEAASLSEKIEEDIAEGERKVLSHLLPTSQNVEAATALKTARQTIQKWLRFKYEQLDLVDLVLSIPIANQFHGDPLWLLIVGPSSSVKTELIRALDGVPGIHTLSGLTARTFASGFERVPSLLDKLTKANSSLLAIKDFGSVLSLNPNEKAEILQQLREIYDGHYKKEFGNGKVVEWRGRLGLLAGVTPAVDRYTSVIGELGDRFLLYRISVNDRAGVANKALSKAGQETTMREEIASAFATVIRTVPPDAAITIVCGEEMCDRIASLADLASWCRTPVARDYRNQIILYDPVPEGPGRLVKALFKLAQGLAAVRGKIKITGQEYELLYQVARDTIPKQRWRVLEYLDKTPDWQSTKAVGVALTVPTSTVQLLLEDLSLLGLIDRKAFLEDGEELKQTTPFTWCLSDRARTLMKAIAQRDKAS